MNNGRLTDGGWTDTGPDGRANWTDQRGVLMGVWKVKRPMRRVACMKPGRLFECAFMDTREEVTMLNLTGTGLLRIDRARAR